MYNNYYISHIHYNNNYSNNNYYISHILQYTFTITRYYSNNNNNRTIPYIKLCTITILLDIYINNYSNTDYITILQ